MPTTYTRALPNMLCVRDIAAYLNICTRLAYQLVKTPGFPLVKLSPKGWRIPREAFFAWLEAQPGVNKLLEARQASGGTRTEDEGE